MLEFVIGDSLCYVDHGVCPVFDYRGFVMRLFVGVGGRVRMCVCVCVCVRACVCV